MDTGLHYRNAVEDQSVDEPPDLPGPLQLLLTRAFLALGHGVK